MSQERNIIWQESTESPKRNGPTVNNRHELNTVGKQEERRGNEERGSRNSRINGHGAWSKMVVAKSGVSGELSGNSVVNESCVGVVDEENEEESELMKMQVKV